MALISVEVKVSNLRIWVWRAVAAGMMLYAFFCQLTGTPQFDYIFSSFGTDPYLKAIVGIVELTASLLIMVPRTSSYGALLSMALMAIAIQSHLLLFGIEVMNDSGFLLAGSIIVLLASERVISHHHDIDKKI
ncbi:MAG: DoxX family protein [Chitinophagaceae bacterium]|nr:DoxX family protein [Chitinophagaceae bacterium]